MFTSGHPGSRPCIGFVRDEDERVEQEHPLSQTPAPRLFSKECQRFVGKDAEVDAHSCRECLKLGETKAVREMGAAVDCKAWLPDGYSRIFRIVCVWPFGLLDYGSATLRCKI